MIFTIICVNSCQLITPFPKFKIIEICPPVFIPVDSDNSIYKVHCRCAPYDMNKSEFVGAFVQAPIRKCDRAYGITLESFLEEVEPTMKEIQEWVLDLKDKESDLIDEYTKGNDPFDEIQ